MAISHSYQLDTPLGIITEWERTMERFGFPLVSSGHEIGGNFKWYEVAIPFSESKQFLSVLEQYPEIRCTYLGLVHLED